MHLNTILLMSGTAVRFLQLFAALSILIVLHEFGHFFFARLFKTRVEKFYLFFDFLFPFSGLLNFSLFKKKKGETTYGIGWFPLGGYVKIAGMVDESMDKEQMAKPPEPWEYRSKKAWQRLFIMLGGIIMNVLVAIVVYIIVFAAYGEKYLETKNDTYGIAVDSLGRSIGLHDGDIIKSVDGKPVERFNRIPLAIIFSKNQTGSIELSHNGKDTTINIPSGTVRKLLKLEKGTFISPAIPPVIDSVSPNTIAMKLGLQHGDSITSVNGESIRFHNEFGEYLHAHYNVPLTITFARNNVIDTITTTIPKDSSLGVFFGDAEKYYHLTDMKYSLGGAIKRGVAFTGEQFDLYLEQFKLIFVSKEVKASESLGGFASFGKLFPTEFDFREFLMLMAFVSIILAFMNLLPIPGLDGGYVIFLLFEIITGKKVSEKVMERATTVGLVLLLALMLYANGLDVFRHFKK